MMNDYRKYFFDLRLYRSLKNRLMKMNGITPLLEPSDP